MKQAHRKDYLSVKAEIMKDAPLWIQQIFGPLNEVYNKGYRNGNAESAKEYGKKNEAVRKMRKWPSSKDNESEPNDRS